MKYRRDENKLSPIVRAVAWHLFNKEEFPTSHRYERVTKLETCSIERICEGFIVLTAPGVRSKANVGGLERQIIKRVGTPGNEVYFALGRAVVSRLRDHADKHHMVHYLLGTYPGAATVLHEEYKNRRTEPGRTIARICAAYTVQYQRIPSNTPLVTDLESFWQANSPKEERERLWRELLRSKNAEIAKASAKAYLEYVRTNLQTTSVSG